MNDSDAIGCIVRFVDWQNTAGDEHAVEEALHEVGLASMLHDDGESLG